ncbi:hypothetical protein T484DRAFT_1830779 [Baffinella frigidus]|nr:hypothetical protein T484DRAFT_1830779 [Cryptophyta sp. CCMP2293]
MYHQALGTVSAAPRSLQIAFLLAHTLAIPFPPRPLSVSSPSIPRTFPGVSSKGFPAASMDASLKMGAGNPPPSAENNNVVASGVAVQRSDGTRSPERPNDAAGGHGSREQSPGRQQDAPGAAAGAAPGTATGAAAVGVRRLFFAVELEEEDKAAITSGTDEALRTSGDTPDGMLEPLLASVAARIAALPERDRVPFLLAPGGLGAFGKEFG